MAVTLLAGSCIVSSSVETVTVTSDMPSANIASVGSVPVIISPSSLTLTVTVNAPAESERVTTKLASAPSSTPLAESAAAAIVTVGRLGSGGSSSSTVAVAELGVPSS